MKHTRVILFGIFIFSLLIVAGCDGDRTFTIDEVGIDAQIDEAGNMQVTEVFTYTFDGEFKGTTRVIDADVENFKAYLTDNPSPTQSTDNLDALKVEADDGEFEIHTKSKDETKYVVYTYMVEGQVKKYQDVGDMTYAFFDDSNETDLHHVSISVTLPGASDDVQVFLQPSATGNVEVTQGKVQYDTDLLEAGESTSFRLIFPADQLTKMKTKNKLVKDDILKTEQVLAERKAHYEENFAKAVPYLVAGMVIVLLFGIGLYIVNPNRKGKHTEIEQKLQIFEETDPLLAQFIVKGESLPYESFLAGLFSLKRRGIVTMEEVPATETDQDVSYRFTLTGNVAAGDQADHYLISWLFTEEDERGSYFLLESIMEKATDSDEEKEEKAEHFQNHFTIWMEMVKEREAYQDTKKRHKIFGLFSLVTTLLTYGLYYYFIQFEILTPTEQTVLPLVGGGIALIAILFNRSKWVVGGFYLSLFIISAILFTDTLKLGLLLLYYTIAAGMVLLVPNRVWREGTRAIKQAGSIMRKQIKQGNYPVGEDPKRVEARLEYAIILGVGEAYAEQCGKQQLPAYTNLPLVLNPVMAAVALQQTPSHMYVTTMAASTSTSSSTSSGGGGGAGAF